MYIGHRREDGAIQELSEHLQGTAGLAGAFAHPFHATKHAERTALLHDVGKCSPAGQARMADPEHTAKVDHATAGVQIARKIGDIPAAFAIAGHHGGLPDIGANGDSDGSGTLIGRITKTLMGPLDYSAWTNIVAVDPAPCFPEWLNIKDAWAMQFYIRMLFSCLVDADYLDTESFMRAGSVERGGGETIGQLLEKLKRYIAPWLTNSDREINQKRSEILRQCIAASDGTQGMYTLTVPTGGGKTVSSLAFALYHAVKHEKKRVIYVIPYTSIIEQNAAVFADMLGAENVLEHHSNVTREESGETTDGHELAAENWDSPIIVTTAVQFFESLFASKPSQCRKLHSIANSVIIFDEAQMLPLNYLRPCIAAIVELVQHYGATAVLCTATQPSLGPLIHEFADKMVLREICRDAEAMQEFFRRVSFSWEGKYSCAEIAQLLSKARQTLCIVNTRKRAGEIYDLLEDNGRFHLSTLMTPADRKKALAEIRKRLKEGKECRVVSTSLIEAGVDVDFPEVWREEAGLDSILQAAGRCNREGRRMAEESIVHVFRADSEPLHTIEQHIAAMRNAVRMHAQPDTAPAIDEYFSFLYLIRGNALDMKGILPQACKMEFRSVSEQFRLIDSDTVTVFIPTEDNAGLIDELRSGQINRNSMRRLSQYGVNIYRQHFNALYSAGMLEECSGLYLLSDMQAYDNRRGLTLQADAGAALWI